MTQRPNGGSRAELPIEIYMAERAEALETASKQTPSSFIRAVYQAQAQILREVAEEVRS